MLSLRSLPQLSFSYNGGKDCLVLLILYLASLSTHPSLPSHLQSIYIVPPHPFPEVDAFVTASSQHYHLSLARYARDSMKAAFAAYLAENPAVCAIFVGTRRTDPHGADLTFFDMTDHGWPGFMRVHPVIDWHYAEIWSVSFPLQSPFPFVCPFRFQGECGREGYMAGVTWLMRNVHDPYTVLKAPTNSLLRAL